MTCREEPDPATLDAYIRTQLSRAADTYASRIDLRTRLETLIREAGKSKEDDDGAAVAKG